MAMEEDFWKQKTNLKWCLEGERNTKFFHDIVKSKRSKNHIFQIMDNGQINDPVNIQSSGVNYFANAFKCDVNNIDAIRPEIIPCLIDYDDNRDLCTMPNIEEIKFAVFNMGADSVAGPDGFNALFFQKCWDVIAVDVCETFSLETPCPNRLLVLLFRLFLKSPPPLPGKTIDWGVTFRKF
ncbi:hypothetical protein OROMI_021022 [Orobanche minor]